MSRHEASAGRARVAVVTGGGRGIGQETCYELARRGVVVIPLDCGVSLDGHSTGEPVAEAVASRIRASGGVARASDASVTEREAVRALFRAVVDEFGSLDMVINFAGILRLPRFLEADQEDWETVLDVHLNGYLNVLSEALPIMTDSGFGRVVGVTSGVGLARTNVEGVAYSAAKRAVAALTWEMRDVLSADVRVNAISPLAATRMVTAVVPEGVFDFAAMPQPADMAPVAAYLASEDAGDWAAGQVVFSAGSELCLISPPRLTEIIRSEGTLDLAGALGTIVPVVLNPAERGQQTTGGFGPRFANVFDEAVTPVRNPGGGHVVVVSDDTVLNESLAKNLRVWGRTTTFLRSCQDFSRAEETLSDVVAERGRFDALVVALGEPAGAGDDEGSWEQVVDSHRGVVRFIVANSAWLRAAGRIAAQRAWPLRATFVTRATSSGGRTAAQALAQVARCVNETPADVEVNVMAVGVESASVSDTDPLAALVARQVCAEDTRALRGAELAVGRGWIGIRNHPQSMATASLGGIDIPEWVDAAFQLAVGRPPRSRIAKRLNPAGSGS